MTLIPRLCENIVKKYISNFPVTALLGPRQSGKSTLAKKIISKIPNSIYIDLELPSDINKLSDPETFFKLNNDKLICLDEIQRLPEIFTIIRSICDMTNNPSQFLLLGSASPDLLKQSSESLAGRIAYYDLTPFTIEEINPNKMRTHWLRGGFPDSFLSKDNEISYLWKENFIRTYLEKDIPALGFSVSTQIIHRLWMMLAHSTANILNKTKLAASLGVTHPTITAYIDILDKTYMVRVLQPYFTNIKKRLIKSPKVYIRDTGILHTLLFIKEQNDLLGHPIYGNSWESYALEQICSSLPEWNSYFYRTSNGAEIDLILEKGLQKIAIEFKVSSAPNLSPGFYHVLTDLNIEETYIVAPIPDNQSYPLTKATTVISVNNIIKSLKLK